MTDPPWRPVSRHFGRHAVKAAVRYGEQFLAVSTVSNQNKWSLKGELTELSYRRGLDHTELAGLNRGNLVV